MLERQCSMTVVMIPTLEDALYYKWDGVLMIQSLASTISPATCVAPKHVDWSHGSEHPRQDTSNSYAYSASPNSWSDNGQSFRVFGHSTYFLVCAYIEKAERG